MKDKVKVIFNKFLVTLSISAIDGIIKGRQFISVNYPEKKCRFKL